jgi:broad specificity phosphatase PhoE/ubiquinone/menaquinone biosynthesis C-methylase UbiE
LDATDLIFVRHGESLHNRGDVSADSDPGLTELGWRQSQLVADWLSQTCHAEVLLSSPMKRATQTAELISRRVKLPVLLLPGLEETTQSYWNELPAAHQTDPFALWGETWAPSAENAPVYSAFRDRLRGAMEQIVADHSGKTVIIVSHGGSIGTILRSLFGGHSLPVFTQNTGVTQVAWKDGHWQLVSHNLQEHLVPLIGRTAPFPTASGSPYPWARNGAFQCVQEHYRRVAQSAGEAGALSCADDHRPLLRMADVTPETVILDVGCGAGDVGLAFAPYAGRVIGLDITSAMLERAELARIARGVGNLDLMWAEATELPIDDSFADIVTARDLLHLLNDPAAFAVEARRVLKPGGILLLDEMVCNPDPVTRATRETIEARRNPSFRRLLSRDEIARLLMSTGYSVEQSETYEVRRNVDDWLACAAADESTRAAVRQMLEAGMDTDAAGLQMRSQRDGGLSFTEQRVRLRASSPLTTARQAADA